MQSTEWLTDDEQRAWRLYQAMSTVLDAALDQQLQSIAQMPHAYYRLLVMLSASPNATCRITALAHATHASQSRTSHAIDALERRGWVRRRRSPEDSRGVLATLTSQGQRALRMAAPEHVRQVRTVVFDRLTSQQVAQLAEISAAILAGLLPDSATEMKT